MQELNEFAIQLADQARLIAKRYFRQAFQIDSKADNTPVSIADKEIEHSLRKSIRSRYPAHGVLGEEYEIHKAESEFLWVIDPIDGTKSFICGHPSFGALIALVKNGKPILGIIEMPALNERWLGISGEGSFFNHQPITTKSTIELADCVFCTTAPDFFKPHELPIFNRLSQCGQFRLFGGDCYSYGLLASGHIDVVMEAGLKPFDFMALIPVIENAGGVVTDWQGKQLTLSSNGQILASANPTLHQKCLDKINNPN